MKRLRINMSLKGQIAEITKIKPKEIPGSFQIIGDVAMVKFQTSSKTKKEKIAKAILAILPYVKTVCEIKGIEGKLREPDVKVIVGTNTTTVHKENNVLYKMDVTKVMYSKGNVSERKRLLPHIKEGETVVDMFAGIGYFSIPIAKFTKAKEVISIEKNPASYNFLSDNVSLNKLTNVYAIQGDCKIAARGLGGRADRVLMGYFPGTEEFLPAAFFMAKAGGIIHYHNVYNEKDLWEKPLEEITSVSEAMKRKFQVISKKKVKSYGPKKYHVVLDLKVL